MADHWLTLRDADSSIGPNTVRADRESLAYARRAFGAVPVQKLTPAALADWSAALTGKGGRASGTGHQAPRDRPAQVGDGPRDARCAG